MQEETRNFIKKNVRKIKFTTENEKVKRFHFYFLLRVFLAWNNSKITYVDEIGMSSKIEKGKISIYKRFILIISAIFAIITTSITADASNYFITGNSFIIGTIKEYFEAFDSDDTLVLKDKADTTKQESSQKSQTSSSSEEETEWKMPENLPYTESGEIDYSKANSYYYGYYDMTITKDERNIHLVNLPENPVGLLFTLQVEGKTIYESKELKYPGETLDVDLYELLPKGEHTMNIIQNFISLNDKSTSFYKFQREIKVMVK